MTLQHRTLLMVAATLGGFFVISFAASQLILRKGFADIEQDDSRQRMERALAALNSQIDKVDAVAADWSAWDDTYDFMTTRSERYIKATLVKQSFVGADLNAIAYIDAGGQIVFARQVDLGRSEEVPLSTGLRQHLAPGLPLTRHTNPEGVVRGILLLPDGVMLVASRPVLRSDRSGPPRGSLVMGRLLDERGIAAMEKALLRRPMLRRVDDSRLPPELREVASALQDGQAFVSRPASHDQLCCFGLVRDVYGKPALLLQLDVPRTIHHQGDLAIATLLGALLLGGILVGAAMLWLLNRHVLSRVRQLNSAARHIADSKDPSRRVHAVGKDEIATLAHSMNSMLEALQETHEELRKARDVAMEVSRVKSCFLATISHEVRTPLHCIVGFAEMAAQSDGDAAAREHARNILSEAETALAIINDLLDHAKIEAGKMDLEKRPVDVRGLLEHAARNARTQVRAKPVQISVQVPANLPPFVLGDPLRIRQVLSNLVTNAVKFTERGSVVIAAELLEVTPPCATLRFAVSDTGIGIPRDRQDAVFDSFTQVDAGTARRYGGTGLGTTIAKHLVTLMHGDIGLQSELGRGSTFWFTVPCEICAAPIEPADGNAADDADPVSRAVGRILLVEDYPSSREVARLYLESAGHTVVAVEDGDRALAACDSDAFDLILLDAQIPGIDGYEVARRIRAGRSRCADRPMLALTAEAPATAHVRCGQVGIDDVITKPIRRRVLLAAVEHWLAVSRAAVRSPSPPQDPNASPIDYPSAIREFGGAAAFEKVLDQFMDAIQGQLGQMKAALDDHDLDVLRREAHKIKGGAATLSASALAEAAARVEALAEINDSVGTARALMEMSAENDRLGEFARARPSAPTRRQEP